MPEKADDGKLNGHRNVDCNQCIELHLSAYADGELVPDEARAVEEHLRGCDRCRAELAAERALKARIHRQFGEPRAPAALAAQIRQALEREALGSVSPAPQASRRSAWFWIPTAIAAGIAIVIVLGRGYLVPNGSVPLFDQAAAKLAAFQGGFAPNVPSGSEQELAQAYRAARMPSGIWNFKNSGFALMGGRVDPAADGGRVTYTVYRGPSHESILCMRLRDADANAIPKDAILRTGGHAFYRYRGLSLCVTVDQNRRFVCILASRMPIERLEQVVAGAAVDQYS